jgi:hypothetical protein
MFCITDSSLKVSLWLKTIQMDKVQGKERRKFGITEIHLKFETDVGSHVLLLTNYFLCSEKLSQYE